jgi:hypothetical protein
VIAHFKNAFNALKSILAFVSTPLLRSKQVIFRRGPELAVGVSVINNPQFSLESLV